MDPKDRVETLIKTKASSIHKRISGNESSAEAGYQVAPAGMEPMLAVWSAGSTPCGQRGQRQARRRRVPSNSQASQERIGRSNRL